MKRSRKQVLILVENNSVPSDTRVWKECKTLTEYGYQVSVICPKGVNTDTLGTETIQNISIYRYPLIYSSESLLGYMLEFSAALFFMAVYSLVIFFRSGFDVIQICNPPDLFFTTALPYKLLGKKIIFDHHDLSPELYLAKKEKKKDNLIYKILLFLEKITFMSVTVIMSTNQSFRQIALGRGNVSPEKNFIVRNGPEESTFSHFVPKLREDNRYVKKLLYIGFMGNQDGLDYLLRSVHYIKHKKQRTDFHVTLIGDGSEMKKLQGYSKELEVDDVVTFTGRMPFNKLLKPLEETDICLCPDPKNSVNDKSTMIKIMEYMAAGKPIVSFDLHENRISAGESALYAEPNDEKDYADKICRLLDDPVLRFNLGLEGKQRIANGLTWEASTVQLLKAYEKALS